METGAWAEPTRPLCRLARAKPQSKPDPGVVNPGFVALGSPRRQAGDLSVRLERWQQGRADEWVRERRIAAASRCIRLELRRHAAHVHGAADGRVALGVGFTDALLPVGVGLCLGREKCARCGCVARADAL